jgi:MazG family protein
MRRHQKSPKVSQAKMDPDRLPKAIEALVSLVARLRGPGGCPWDAKQTDSSIKIYLLEEAYEVLEAIEKSSSQEVCMELGDLLFQILFLAQIAAERNEFDFIEVVERITEKMIHRHPHVFGEVRVDGAEDVAHNWAEIKKKEKGALNDSISQLEGIPTNLPALLRAHRLIERASRANLDWADTDEIWGKVEAQFKKLKMAVTSKERDLVAEQMGQLLFDLVNLGRRWGLNAEDLLRLANQKFLKCVVKMERDLKSSGITLEKATPEQIRQAWDRVRSRAG